MSATLGAESLGWGVPGSADEPAAALSMNESEVDEALLDALRAEGEALYLKNCRQCHGSRGTSGVPLAGNHRLHDNAHVVDVIVNGPRYMPAFGGYLSDEEIAAVATYVSISWGNEFGVITEEYVADLR